jgi:thioredoxin reductase (NADPH)
VRWRHNPTGKEIEKPIRNVLVFIGADPATHWLKDCGVLLDRNGLVRTGPSLAPDELAMNARLPMLLESNIFGVFAVVDVRCGSVKRVGGAIGEGAAVVPELHSFFMDTPVAPQCGPEELWPKVGDGSLKQPISRVTEYCGRSARSSRPA